MALVYLSLAMTSAMGAAALWPRSPGRTCAMIALVLIDYLSVPVPLWRIEIPRVYHVLAMQTDRGALLELPMGVHDGLGSRGSLDPASPMFQTVHEHPVVGGYISRIPPRIVSAYVEDPIFGPLLRASEGVSDEAMPEPRALPDGLRARGIRYVVLRRPGTPAALVDYVERALARFSLARDDDRELFDVMRN